MYSKFDMNVDWPTSFHFRKVLGATRHLSTKLGVKWAITFDIKNSQQLFVKKIEHFHSKIYVAN